MTTLHSLFCTQLLKSSLCFYTYSTFYLIFATTLVLNNHMWLVATILESAGLEEELLSDKKMGTVNDETYA